MSSDNALIRVICSRQRAHFLRRRVLAGPAQPVDGGSSRREKGRLRRW
jgi:hypothetical protein